MSIQEHLNKIRNAIYGREVRESIAKGIETAYDDASENGNANMEVKIARGTHPNLRSRLEEVDNKQQQTTAQLAHKANVTDLDNLGKLELSGEYNNLVELTTIHPEGSQGLHLVIEDGYIYRWDGANWVKTVNFQSDGIGDRSVTYLKQDFISIDEKGRLTLKEETDVSNNFVEEWINFDNDVWDNTTELRSIVYPIRKNAKVTVKTKGYHNRFTIYTSDDSSSSKITGKPKKVFVKNGDGHSSGDEVHSFYNTDKSFIIIGLRSSTTAGTPSVKLTQEYEEGSKRELEEIKKQSSKNYPPITNIVRNGDFSNGISEWTSLDVTASVDNNVATFTANETGGMLRQIDKRVKGHVMYISVEVKSLSNKVGVDLNNLILEDMYSKGSGTFERLSTQYTSPQSGDWYYAVRDMGSDLKPISIKNFIIIDLTETFGVGNEPTKEMMDYILEKKLNGKLSKTESNYYNVFDIVNDNEKYLFQKNSFKNIQLEDDIFPIMFGVKMNNHRTDEVPRPVGWLYYHPISYDLYYAVGKPDNLSFLCKWNKSITWNGISSPFWYKPQITREGDIIFVFRGDMVGQGTDEVTGRQNPIVYKKEDYSSPVVVDIKGQKPTAWLQSSGNEYIYNDDIFMFAEYTRPHHKNANIWRVTKPFDNPENWKIVETQTLSGSNIVGMKHFHTMSYDTFSGEIISTTGDDDTSSKIYKSTDRGLTFEVVADGSRRRNRLTYMLFLENGAYWASDDYSHALNFAPRVNGSVDFGDIQELISLDGYPPTYATVFVEDPYGLLLLLRHDGNNDGSIDVLFYDLHDNSLHVLKTFNTILTQDVDGTYSPFGFRMEAINVYQPRGDSEIVLGFANPPNYIDVLNNRVGTLEDTINTMCFNVIKTINGYKLRTKSVKLI